MKTASKWTADELTRAQAMRLDGKTCAAIAKALCRTPDGVRLKLQAAKHTPNGHSKPKAARAVPPTPKAPAPWPTPDGRMPPKTLWRTVARKLSNDDLGHLAREAVAERDRRIAQVSRTIQSLTHKEVR